MKSIISVSLLLSLLIGFEGDGGSGGDYRRYQNVTIAPFTQKQGTTMYYQFANTYNNAVTLTFKITNSQFNQAVLYSQHFQTLSLLTSSLLIPGYVFDGGISQLHLIAFGPSFNQQVNLNLYPKQHLQINLVETALYRTPQARMTTINSNGIIHYVPQTIWLQGFEAIRHYPYYGRMSLHNISMNFTDDFNTEFTNYHAYLLVPPLPQFEGFMASETGEKIIPLSIVLQDHLITFRFHQLYVHPQTLALSPFPLTGYVQTNHIFFPLQQFGLYQSVPMTMMIEVNQVHQYQFIYAFQYVADFSLIGHCHQSWACITTHYA
jgi:hypothetical protein